MSTPAKLVSQSTAASELARKVCALESPRAYPDAASSVVAIETHLNRPLAQDIYLGVVPLVEGADGRLHAGGTGTIVDWLVRMRRLPAARMLDRAIASESAPPARLSALGLWLAQFYLSFYRGRRAMVRAKIVAWHLLDPAVMAGAPWRELAHTYLVTAESYARQVV